MHYTIEQIATEKDATALTFKGFSIYSRNLVGCCTILLNGRLSKISMLSQVFYISQNIEISHDRLQPGLRRDDVIIWKRVLCLLWGEFTTGLHSQTASIANLWCCLYCQLKKVLNKQSNCFTAPSNQALTLIPAWISNCTHCIMWYEISCHTSLGMWLLIHAGIEVKPCC